MLLFIFDSEPSISPANIVSIHLMLLFIVVDIPEYEEENEFQYISCYSLSKAIVEGQGWRSWFQYISCYSLSNQKFFYQHPVKRFNTSHVTLYPFSCSVYSFIIRVSIHLMLLFIDKGRTGNKRRTGVSIHLMLLFIVYVTATSSIIPMFQYISCYSLSPAAI